MADLESDVLIVPSEVRVAAKPVVRSPSRAMLELEARTREADQAKRNKRRAEKRAKATAAKAAKRGKARRHRSKP